jgi:hypothetical protein
MNPAPDSVQSAELVDPARSRLSSSATSPAAIDAALDILQARKDAWVATGIDERLAIQREASAAVVQLGHRWVHDSLAAKGFESGSMAEAEEWIAFATVTRMLRLLQRSLSDIRREGCPRIGGPLGQSRSSQLVAPVMPLERWDRLVYAGITGEVWMEPGVTAAELWATQARPYREKNHAGKVALVLGAGNISAIPVVDTLHKLFVEDQVVVLKPNPVNAYLGPLIEQAFAGLIRRGFLRVVYGGIEEGSYLVNHPQVDELHMTGSAATFDAITFGAGEEGRRRKQAREPLVTKRFTAELGNISPVIVVPGPWSDGDLHDQAEQIVTWLVANAGFGCLTPRVLIQQASWPLRDALLEAIGRELARVPARNAYYPGAHETHAAFLAAHPEARQYGNAGGGYLPWTFITGVDPGAAGDVCFTREPFCGLMSETALEGADPAEFIDRAVAFANETLWGSLNATIIVHPRSLRDRRVTHAVENAIANLRYGTVLVNMSSFAGYYFLTTPWGAFPGHGIRDIQSGTGKTSNVLMFERPQKSVVRGPFRKRGYPIRVTAKRPHSFVRDLAMFESSRSPGRMARLLWSALRA